MARKAVKRKPKLINELAKKHGYSSYAVYLKSAHWTKFQAKYKKSGRPQRCLACGYPQYQLHHVNYQNFGREKLTDVIPLCVRCHKDLHRVSRRYKIPLSQPEVALQRVFRWNTAQLKAVWGRHGPVPKTVASPAK